MGNTALVLADRRRQQVHSRPSTGSYVDRCRAIPTQVEWENYLRNYAQKMHKNRKCMQCFMEFKNVSSLLTHLGSNHLPTVSYSTYSEDGKPMCLHCRKSFGSAKALQAHNRSQCQNYWKSLETQAIPKDVTMKYAGQKRPKLKHRNEDSLKKQKVHTLLEPKKQKSDADNFSIPTQLPVTHKKSVKTINSGSCIRQFSRPILPNCPSTSGNSTGMVKTLNANLPASRKHVPIKPKVPAGKSKARAANKSPYSDTRCRSPRSYGLIDFDKIKTTARTRNMIGCGQTFKAKYENIYDISMRVNYKPAGVAKKKGEASTALVTTSESVIGSGVVKGNVKGNSGIVKSPGGIVKGNVSAKGNGGSAKGPGGIAKGNGIVKGSGGSVKGPGGSVKSKVNGSSSNNNNNNNNNDSSNNRIVGPASELPESSKVKAGAVNPPNGIKELKSYLILKVMPIVASPNKTMVKTILPKQAATNYQKIQPKPQIVLQNTPKPLLVLKIPDCNLNNGPSKEHRDSVFANNTGIRANKKYQAQGKKRKANETDKEDSEDAK